MRDVRIKSYQRCKKVVSFFLSSFHMVLEIISGISTRTNVLLYVFLFATYLLLY